MSEEQKLKRKEREKLLQFFFRVHTTNQTNFLFCCLFFCAVIFTLTDVDEDECLSTEDIRKMIQRIEKNFTTE